MSTQGIVDKLNTLALIAGEEEGMFWQRPWRLRAGVMYGWRAHRQRLTAIATHPNEHMVATAGKGHVAGQDQDVVRCWNLADAAAGGNCCDSMTITLNC